MLSLLLACATAPPAPPEAPLPEHVVFPSTEAALSAVIASAPRVLGVGEIHSSADGPGGASTISRFTDRMLPVLAPTTTDLVIETWVLESACGEAAAAVVAQVQEETKRPEEVKSEIVLLAEKAAALGVRPHDLTLSCAEYDGLRTADGEIAYDALLALLTAKLQDFALRGLQTEDARLVLYGGAVHNDLFPNEALASFSYGAAARAAGGDAYVELDLYGPEQLAAAPALIQDAWAPLLGAVGPDRALLYQRGPGSYVLLMEGAPFTPPAVAE